MQANRMAEDASITALSQKIDVSTVAETFRGEVKSAVKALHDVVTPLLVGFLANGDEAARKYAEWTAKACREDGITFELRECKQIELEDKIKEANQDPKVHGIMIYYPCFGAQPSFYGGSMDDYLRDIVSVEKDVEGLCYTYRRNLYTNIRFLSTMSGDQSDKQCLLPCTPLAIVKLLETLHAYDPNLPKGNRLLGKTVTIINRSEIVGRPLAAMLANDGADVYSVDIGSIYMMRRGRMLPVDIDVHSACEKSHVIVTGVPSQSYKLPSAWVKPNTIVLNVSNFKNVDEEKLLEIPNVRYVPLVGKVTVAMLERNLLRLIQNFHTPGEECEVDVEARVIRNHKRVKR